MESLLKAEFVVPLLLVLCALSGTRIARETERIVVFRLGRLHRVAGPGLLWIIPGVDKGLRISLNQALPEWRALSPQELAERVREYACRPPT